MSVTAKKPYNTFDIAGYIINTCHENNISITYNRLNIYLYFTQMQSLIETGRPMFNEDFIPAGDTIYMQTTINHWRSYLLTDIPVITKYWDISQGWLKLKKAPFKPRIQHKDKRLIDDVCKTCGTYTMTQLKNIIKGHGLTNKANRRVVNTITLKDFEQYVTELKKKDNMTK